MNKKEFEMICRASQDILKGYLNHKLKKEYEEVICNDGYLFAKGDIPILLIAHMDTVHEALPKRFVYENKGDKISAPQGIGGDDRCGIYMITEIIKKHKCSVLFCEDEEKGGIGASKFVKESFAKDLEFNYMIELDRRGDKDAVFYDCDNEKFEDFITEDGDWKTAWGSFSDISILAPKIGCAAVNLSCGYYNAHTDKEYVILSEMEANIEKVCKLIERTTEEDKFEYIERKFTGRGYYGSYYGGWSEAEFFGETEEEFEDFGMMGLYGVTFNNDEGQMDFKEVYARSDYEAIGIFLSEHPNMTFAEIEVDFFGYDEYYM